MSKGSPSTDRVIAILNYFIAYPMQSFTVAQVVKSLKLSRTTCTNILISLAQSGYIYRGSDGRYMLGPAFLATAQRAQMTFDPIEVARLEIRHLADKLDAVVALHTRDNDQVVPRARAASARHLSLSYPPDLRHALHPWGVLFLAGLDDAQIEAAFDAARPPLGDSERKLERDMIAFARRHGFLFAVRPAEEPQRPRIPTRVAAMGDYITELDPDRDYRLLFIMAPVFDRSGQIVFEVVVSGFDRDFSGTEIAEMASTALESCQQIANYLSGQSTEIQSKTR